MKRIPEPELMDTPEQAAAYAEADFEEPHSQIVSQFQRVFPNVEVSGEILDLGCGPGDIAFRFARLFPHSRVTGVDGSHEMLKLSEERAETEALTNRLTFIQGIIPGVPLPEQSYDAIVSNSLLHHLHHPEHLWSTVRAYSRPETLIFIADLMRPDNPETAREIMEKHSGNEPEVLQRDFYNSLHAAFEIEEIREQLQQADLNHLQVEPISDRHLLVWGRFDGAPF
ncbi:MAG: class I SAM-dependent methyltransferase [Candidatus Omnitrophica bacterium]|nr:class I SAM-dependent methyltransferase [Candidatus Omnitrophota bacterium]